MVLPSPVLFFQVRIDTCTLLLKYLWFSHFRVCAFSIQRTRLSRSLKQAILSCATLYGALYLTLVRLYVCANKFGQWV